MLIVSILGGFIGAILGIWFMNSCFTENSEEVIKKLEKRVHTLVKEEIMKFENNCDRRYQRFIKGMLDIRTKFENLEDIWRRKR